MTWYVDVAAGEDAFSVVYRRCHAPTVRLAYLLTGDLAGAEDLAHDVWVSIYRAHVDKPIADIESYVRRSLINGARNRARRMKLERAYLSSLRPRAVPDRSEGVADRLVVLDRLGRLPARMRAVVVLRLYADVSVADTAAALGVSEGTVKSTTAKALTRLRTIWEEDEDV